MVKRTITITTVLLILSMIVSLIIILNKSSFAAEEDIASGISGSCSWVIDSDYVLTIKPTDGISGILDSYYGSNYSINSNVPWYDYQTSITGVIIKEGVKTNTSCDFMFYNFKSCTVMDLSNLDTSMATSMKFMFGHCEKVKLLNLASWRTENLTDMGGMFFCCKELESLDVSTWNTSKVTQTAYYENQTVYGMFQGCTRLTNLDLSNFDTSKCKTFTAMFNDCFSLRELNICNFNMESMTGNLSEWLMFGDCNNLSKIVMSPNFEFNFMAEGAYFCTPMAERDGTQYTGKWIREEDGFGPFEATQLCENYNSTYAGTWIWEEERYYFVKYSYIGEVPENASKLPEEEEYRKGEEVIVAEDAKAEGYTFSGWSIKDSFEMPAEDVIITGSFTPITETSNGNDEKPEDPTNNDNKPTDKENYQQGKELENKEINVKENKKIIYNPKTGDRLQKYLIYGTLGIVALLIVNKIRRKYSRKMKKVQF